MDVLFDLFMSPKRKQSPKHSAKQPYLPLPTGLTNNKYTKSNTWLNRLTERSSILYISIITIITLLCIVLYLTTKLHSVEMQNIVNHAVSSTEPSNTDVRDTYTTTIAASDSKRTQHSNADTTKLEQIKQSFLHGYNAYTTRCMDADDLNPVSGTCHQWVGQLNTLVDSLSTMYLMGLTDEFSNATIYIEQYMSIDETDKSVSFFETTIRVLGGLLSAYSLTHNTVYMHKAVKLADRLKLAFDSHTGLPASAINLKTGESHTYEWSGHATLLSEIGTFQLEYYYLSHITGDTQYSEYADTVYEWFVAHKQESKDGLYPAFVNGHTGTFANKEYLFGGMSDSFYEYLLKSWLLTGKQNNALKQLYIDAMNGLFKYSYHSVGDNAWLADISNTVEKHKMEHLACFIPGLLYLGVAHGIYSDQPDMEQQHTDAAVKLTDTCYKFYTMSPTGLAPESVSFDLQTGAMRMNELPYKLRPEVLESITILYHLTGDNKYREMGWTIYQSIEQYAKVQYGYSGLKDCTNAQSHDDRMESYFFAETLKYLYLLFSDSSALPLVGESGEYHVLNTEAHPLKSWSHDETVAVAL